VKRNLHVYGFLIYLTCIFFFILALYPVLSNAPGAQAPIWASAENKAILVVGNKDDEAAIQSEAAVRKKLKELKAEGVIKYKLLAYDFSVGEHRKYLNELGIGASALPLVAIVELNPNDSPKKVLWRTSAREPDSAVRALLSEMGIKVETATRPQPTLTPHRKEIGTLVLPDGGRYEGDIVDGNANGKGVATWSNGRSYDGDWVDDKKNGKGVFTWADGRSYDGDWVDDKINGKGVFTSANGDRYDGDWVDGKENGKGVHTWKDGDRFEGVWVDGTINGKGVYTWANGNRFEGVWVNGVRNGAGTFYAPNGSVLQNGIWKDDKFVESR
jgi:hypothetical protein